MEKRTLGIFEILSVPLILESMDLTTTQLSSADIARIVNLQFRAKILRDQGIKEEKIAKYERILGESNFDHVASPIFNKITTSLTCKEFLEFALTNKSILERVLRSQPNFLSAKSAKFLPGNLMEELDKNFSRFFPNSNVLMFSSSKYHLPKNYYCFLNITANKYSIFELKTNGGIDLHNDPLRLFVVKGRYSFVVIGNTFTFRISRVRFSEVLGLYSSGFFHLPATTSKHLEVVEHLQNEAVTCLYEENGKLFTQTFNTKDSDHRKIAFAKVFEYSEFNVISNLKALTNQTFCNNFIKNNLYLKNVILIRFKESHVIKQWVLEM